MKQLEYRKTFQTVSLFEIQSWIIFGCISKFYLLEKNEEFSPFQNYDKSQQVGTKTEFIINKVIVEEYSCESITNGY